MSRKTWLITGVSSGLGRSLAERVIECGDFVIGTLRKPSDIEVFNKRYAGQAKGILLDITDIDRIDEVIKDILYQHAKIDVLVNNAGIGFVGAIEEASIEEVRQIFEVNFFGTLRLTQSVLRSMRAHKSGHIVQISSHAGVKASAGFGIYNASKFALEGFSEALAHEVEPLGIGVTIVEPGPFRTNFAGGSLFAAHQTIEDYDKTAGAFKLKLQEAHGKQEGDPSKAAQIIYDSIHADDRTLRLPLGSIPIKTIGMKIESLSADLAANKDIAASAIY